MHRSSTMPAPISTTIAPSTSSCRAYHTSGTLDSSSFPARTRGMAFACEPSAVCASHSLSTTSAEAGGPRRSWPEGAGPSSIAITSRGAKSTLNFDAVERVAVAIAPFEFLTAGDLLNDEDLAAVQAEFPRIDKPGVFLLGSLEYGRAFADWAALDPPNRRRRTMDAAKRLLLREAQVQPLLVVIEDLHWIDFETQALLDGIVESLPAS